MVIEYVGYSGTLMLLALLSNLPPGLNVLGISFELLGFILMLRQFHSWIDRIGRWFGDTETEIEFTKRSLDVRGIYLIILGLLIQLSGALITVYLSK